MGIINKDKQMYIHESMLRDVVMVMLTEVTATSCTARDTQGNVYSIKLKNSKVPMKVPNSLVRILRNTRLSVIGKEASFDGVCLVLRQKSAGGNLSSVLVDNIIGHIDGNSITFLKPINYTVSTGGVLRKCSEANTDYMNNLNNYNGIIAYNRKAAMIGQSSLMLAGDGGCCFNLSTLSNAIIAGTQNPTKIVVPPLVNRIIGVITQKASDIMAAECKKQGLHGITLKLENSGVITSSSFANLLINNIFDKEDKHYCGIADLHISEGITTISSSAFANSIRSVFIPYNDEDDSGEPLEQFIGNESDTSRESSVKWRVAPVAEIQLPKSLKYLSATAFSGCEIDRLVANSVLRVDYIAMKACCRGIKKFMLSPEQTTLFFYPNEFRRHLHATYASAEHRSTGRQVSLFHDVCSAPRWEIGKNVRNIIIQPFETSNSTYPVKRYFTDIVRKLATPDNPKANIFDTPDDYRDLVKCLVNSIDYRHLTHWLRTSNTLKDPDPSEYGFTHERSSTSRQVSPIIWQLNSILLYALIFQRNIYMD